MVLYKTVGMAQSHGTYRCSVFAKYVALVRVQQGDRISGLFFVRSFSPLYPNICSTLRANGAYRGKNFAEILSIERSEICRLVRVRWV